MIKTALLASGSTAIALYPTKLFLPTAFHEFFLWFGPYNCHDLKSQDQHLVHDQAKPHSNVYSNSFKLNIPKFIINILKVNRNPAQVQQSNPNLNIKEKKLITKYSESKAEF